MAVSQKGINGINLILVCWQKFWKAKSYFNNFWMLVIKNGCGLLGLGALKSAVSQEWFDGLGWFFACWYKFMKAKSYFNNYWVGVVKNGWDLKDRGSLKPGISQKWFDELSRLIEWFLHANSDGIIFCSTLYLWHLNAWGPLQVYLARVFRKNSLCAKMITRKGFLLLTLKILSLTFAGNVLK